MGSPFVVEELGAFAERCGVVTFDHEQVDLDIVAALAAGGAVLRPGADALELAVDKARMRTVLDAAGVPVPSLRRGGRRGNRRRMASPRSPPPTAGRSC